MIITAKYFKKGTEQVDDISLNRSIIGNNFDNSYKLNRLLVNIKFDKQVPTNYIHHLFEYKTTGTKLLFIGELLISLNELEKKISSFVYSKNYQNQFYSELLDINGTWLIFIENMLTNEVTVLRDPIGIFNLYYSDTEKDAYLSTSLIQLRNITKNNQISKSAIFQFLNFLYIPSPKTIYEKIYSLIPGNALKISVEKLDTINIENNRFIEREINDIIPIGEKELLNYVKEFELILKKSLEKRIGDKTKKVGIFLSGGKDSSSIAIAASKIDPSLFTCINIGFSNKTHDESKDAELVAKHLGLNFQKYQFSDEEYYAGFDKYLKLHEQPFLDISGLPVTISSSLMNDSFDLLIDGTGNDYYLGIKPNRKQKISTTFNKHTSINNFLNYLYNYYPESILFKYVPHYPTVFKSWNGFNMIDANKILGTSYNLDSTEFYKISRSFNKEPAMLIRTLLICKVWEPNCAFQKVFRNLYQYENSITFPFADNEFLSFFNQNPFFLSHTKHENKVLIRKYLELNLPDKIVKKEKGSFIFDAYSFLKHDNKKLINENLSKEVVDKIGVLDYQLVKELIKQFDLNNITVVKKILALVTFSKWYTKVHLNQP
jgi:asparagine synthase (glutamine-hydrolysing)